MCHVPSLVCVCVCGGGGGGGGVRITLFYSLVCSDHSGLLTLMVEAEIPLQTM